MNAAAKIHLYCGTLGILCLTSLKNYLLFHSLAELFSIVIAFFDTLHALACKGMNIFKGYDDNLAHVPRDHRNRPLQTVRHPVQGTAYSKDGVRSWLYALD